MGVGRTREEAVIRRLIEDWASAVRARKIGAVVAHHTDDVVMFDVPPPVAVRGTPPIERHGQPFFNWLREANGTFEIVELDIAAGDTVAFATALLRCGSKAELAKDNRAAPASDDRAAKGRGHVEDRPRASLLPGGRVDMH